MSGGYAVSGGVNGPTPALEKSVEVCHVPRDRLTKDSERIYVYLESYIHRDLRVVSANA